MKVVNFFRRILRIHDEARFQERRRHPRFTDYQVGLVVTPSQHSVKVRMLDIGMGGAHFQPERTLVDPTDLSLYVRGSQVEIHLPLRVVRRSVSDGRASYAATFEALDLESMTALRTYLGECKWKTDFARSRKRTAASAPKLITYVIP